MKIVLALIGLIMLAGCSPAMPSLTQELRKPASAINLAPLSDERVLNYMEAVYQEYGGRSVRAQIAAVGGPLVLDAATVVATVASVGGATGPTTALTVGIWGFFARALGLIDPAQRANAYAGGLKRLRRAEATYLMAVATKHRGIVPTNLSTAGARLAREVLLAQELVGMALVSMLPDEDDLAALRAGFEKIISEVQQREVKDGSKETDKSEVPTAPPAPGSP